MIKPQQRTLKNLTDRGYLCASVEKRKSFPDRKKQRCRACGHDPQISVSVDLWNVFDIVAIMPTKSPAMNPVAFVQTTSRNNHATRRNKILASMEAKLVLLSGASILLQSWRQDAKGHWMGYDEWITLDMYNQAPHYPNTVAELQAIKRKEKKEDLPKGSTLPLSVDFNGIPF
jgi:hypothetical protein